MFDALMAPIKPARESLVKTLTRHEMNPYGPNVCARYLNDELSGFAQSRSDASLWILARGPFMAHDIRTSRP